MKISKKDRNFYIGMSLVILSIVLSVVISGCGDYERTEYKYKIEVVYENGDKEIIKFTDPSRDNVYLKDGDLRISSGFGHIKTISSTVRRYTVLEKSKEVIK